MDNSGRALEALVSFVETKLLPPGFKVTNNRREYDDGGEQLAEFDIVVEGKLGSTEIRWLIECRDRPAQGPAPGAWIEQLAGRRSRFGFNKVTAVSTAGFSASAVDAAARGRIELRTVAALAPESFSDWLQLSGIHERKYVHDLKHCLISPPPDATQEQLDALHDVLRSARPGAQIFKAVKTGECFEPRTVFLSAASSDQSLKDGVDEGSPPKSVALTVQWPTDDHFVVDTAVGPVRIHEAKFIGEIRVETEFIPIGSSKEYRNAADGTPISQVVAFPVELETGPINLELHRIVDKGIFVVARVPGADGKK